MHCRKLWRCASHDAACDPERSGPLDSRTTSRGESSTWRGSGGSPFRMPVTDELPPADAARLVAKVKEMGLYGLDIPPQYGGPEIDPSARVHPDARIGSGTVVGPFAVIGEKV